MLLLNLMLLLNWVCSKLAASPLLGLESNCSTICYVDGWADQALTDVVGQPVGVDVASNGDVYVFHRGDRIWDGDSFDENNTYTGPTYPIPNDTINVVDGDSGALKRSFGGGIFYLPHMLTVDRQGNVWVTDVARHQVIKMTASGVILLTLGVEFIPGQDDEHFCKPTSVAVSSDGRYFFVADGYCNSRIIKYELVLDEIGGHEAAIKLFEWGYKGFWFESPFAFDIPHSLALDESRNLICLADRENGRIVCFNATDGSYVLQVRPDEDVVINTSVFGIDIGGMLGQEVLFAVSGPFLPFAHPEGFLFDLDHLDKPVVRFNVPEKGLQNPHDIAVHFEDDIQSIYIVEYNPFLIHKFVHRTD